MKATELCCEELFLFFALKALQLDNNYIADFFWGLWFDHPDVAAFIAWLPLTSVKAVL